MPIYVYQVILEDGIEGPIFEVEQSIKEAALKVHPVTGHKVVKLITKPNINKKGEGGVEKKIKDNKYLEKMGFSKYERDKVSGKYNKVAGKEGPGVIKRPE